jgi:hypothetical protein
MFVPLCLTFRNRASYIGRAHRYPPNTPILCIFSTNTRTEFFKHAAHSPFFFSLGNAVYFIMLPFLGACIIRILHTGCAKI